MPKTIKYWLRVAFVSGLSSFLVINPVNASALWAAVLQHGGCGSYDNSCGSYCPPVYQCGPVCHPPIHRCGPIFYTPPIRQCPPPCWMTVTCPPPSSCCSPVWSVPVAPQCGCGVSSPIHVYGAPQGSIHAYPSSPAMPSNGSMNRGSMSQGSMSPGSSVPSTGWNPPPPGASSTMGNMSPPMATQQRLKPQQPSKPSITPEENTKPSLSLPINPRPKVTPPTPNETVPSNPFPSDNEKPAQDPLDLDALMPANDPPADTGSGETGNNDFGSGDAGNGDAGNGDAGNGDAGNGDAGNGDANIMPELNLDSDANQPSTPVPSNDGFPADEMTPSNDPPPSSDSFDNTSPPAADPAPANDSDFDFDSSPSEDMPANNPPADRAGDNANGADEGFDFGSDNQPANNADTSVQPGSNDDAAPNKADPKEEKEEFDWLDTPEPTKTDPPKPTTEGDETFPTSQEQPRAGDQKDNDSPNWLDDLGMMRKWIDNTGNYSTQARLVTIFPDKVRLLKDNGHYTTVPFRRLSDDDKKFVRWVAIQLTQQPEGQYVNTKAQQDVK